VLQHHRTVSIVISVLGLGLLLAACSSGTSPAPKGGSGATVTFAELPGSPPNYISPLASGAYFSAANLPEFSQYLYPPVYWLRGNGTPTLNAGMSVGNPPVFSANNTVATITLKHWVWSNGQPVNARDLVFWMNLLSAVTDPKAPSIGSSTSPGPGWGALVPGGFPQNVVSYKQTGPYSVVFDLNGSYNPTWFVDNEFSQLNVLPQSVWDKLSNGGAVGNYDASAQARVQLGTGTPALYVPSSPGTASSGALGVAEYINLQAQNTGAYTTSPMWQVVDGPFKLSAFTNSGFFKLVPNRSYSGSPKPAIGALEGLPFTSDQAELNSIVSKSLTIGYLPQQDLSQLPTLKKKGYDFNPWYNYSIHYFAYNFTNPSTGPLIRQLYFRQALQYLVDQPAYIHDFNSGIGQIDNGPVPNDPAITQWDSPLETHGEVYPYRPSGAAQLLKAHGWDVRPGGTSTCSSPGTGSSECGAGIKAGEGAVIPTLYGAGSTSLTNTVETLQSTAAKYAGIQMQLKSMPSGQQFALTFAGCTTATPCSDWTISYIPWGFDPDYLPTGGEVFACGSGSNPGDYCDSTNQVHIAATHSAPTQAAEIAAMFKYEDYLARQLPVMWMPNGPSEYLLYKSSLGGRYQNTLSPLFAQYYRVSG
jgi:peptide/nickel transport system substrate-binding protein